MTIYEYYCLLRDSSTLEGQVPVFISRRNGDRFSAQRPRQKCNVWDLLLWQHRNQWGPSEARPLPVENLIILTTAIYAFQTMLRRRKIPVKCGVKIVMKHAKTWKYNTNPRENYCHKSIHQSTFNTPMYDNFFYLKPLLFASCTDTFSKWCKITRGMKRSAQ
jgi:hypothetical protein